MDVFWTRSARRQRKGLILLLCALPFVACNELVSVGLNSAPGDGDSFDAELSADGLVVVFDSAATNLVANDTNGGFDVFLRNRAHASTERLSVKSDGSEAACCSFTPRISGDGRFVVFASTSPDLVPAGTTGVLLRDRTLGTTRLLGSGRRPAISADGKWVVFLQNAVVVAPPGGLPMVAAGTPLVMNLETGEIDASLSQLVSTAADLSLSADGRSIAFSLYQFNVNFIPGQMISAAQVAACSVRVFDRDRRILDLVAPVGTAGFSQRPSLSGDGRIVVFDSTNASLVPGDTNRVFDVFSADRTTGVIERISVNDSGMEGNGGSAVAAVSADGDRVLFSSFASNLDAGGDTNGVLDIFVRVRSRGLTRRLSVANDGSVSNGSSNIAAISANGRISAFTSRATNLSGFADMGTVFDVFEKPLDDVLPAPPMP